MALFHRIPLNSSALTSVLCWDRFGSEMSLVALYVSFPTTSVTSSRILPSVILAFQHYHMHHISLYVHFLSKVFKLSSLSDWLIAPRTKHHFENLPNRSVTDRTIAEWRLSLFSWIFRLSSIWFCSSESAFSCWFSFSWAFKRWNRFW